MVNIFFPLASGQVRHSNFILFPKLPRALHYDFKNSKVKDISELYSDEVCSRSWFKNIKHT